MKQTSSILSTYTADVSGVASALYEMGGMTIMHDASGCNSTYNTHDEPRWYDMPSMVYVSALAEVDALMGDDEKLICDVCRAALELKPRFVAVAGTPIPMMMGTDLPAIARLIEARCGMPTLGLATNSMHSYNSGASMALEAIARRFCGKDVTRVPRASGARPSVNLLGVTPLDFSVTGNVPALRALFEENGCSVVGCWAMGSSWDELMHAGEACVNVVVSSCGEGPAAALREIYGTPCVTGLPVGESVTLEMLALIEKAAACGEDQSLLNAPRAAEDDKIFVIGEPVQCASIARALREDYRLRGVRAISPLGFPDEDAIFSALKKADIVIADPLFRAAAPADCRFVSLPHEGFSGRIYRGDIPIFIGGAFNEWIERELSL
ncbi:MAG: nitrogenase component 1 [Cloacibacillus sp.]